MEQRRWSPPAAVSAQGPATAPAETPERSRRSHWGVVEYIVSFVYYMLFFGAIGGWFHSRFPIDLGLFLFFTDDELIEWALRTVGIRLIPESFGTTFIGAFVWITGASILLARWKDAAPAWLSSGMNTNPSWYVIAGAALAFAVLATISLTAVRKLLPWVGIKIAPGGIMWATARAVIEFGLLALLVLVGSATGWG